MPLSVKNGVGKWVKDFQKSDAPQFKTASGKKRQQMAVAAFLDAKRKNEDFSFEELRQKHLNDGFSHLKSTISEMDIRFKPLERKPNPITANADKSPLEIADRAHSLYREKINPLEKAEKGEIDLSEPETAAARINRKAMLNAALKFRNGGNEGQTSPGVSCGAGGNETNSGSRLAGVGLAPCTGMTIEEYEAFVTEKFNSIFRKEEKEIIEEEKEVIEEEVDIVEILKDRLLELTETNWQEVDSVMRRVSKEFGITPRKLHQTFKECVGVIPDQWLKENGVVEECGVFPLDEVARINKVGQIYEVSFIYRGITQRVNFFWPEVKMPTKVDMQKAVEKFYPTAKLLVFYPAQIQSDNSTMVFIGPRFENYEVYSEEDWGFMSEESTEIYNEICVEEGEPVSPPYLIEENVYEMVVEDHVTGEQKKVRFEEVGTSGGGKSFLKKV